MFIADALNKLHVLNKLHDKLLDKLHDELLNKLPNKLHLLEDGIIGVLIVVIVPIMKNTKFDLVRNKTLMRERK